jgi:hypothetical protein
VAVRPDRGGVNPRRFSTAACFCVLACLWAMVHPGTTAACEASRAAGEKTELQVPDIQVYLTDGFANDHVVVSVDGRTIFDQAGITTKKMIGLAEELSAVPVPAGKASVEVKLPEKNLSATFEVDLSKGSHVPVTLQDGQLTHKVRSKIGFM